MEALLDPGPDRSEGPGGDGVLTGASAGAPHRIIYDGACGFCSALVERVLARDSDVPLEAVPFQDEEALRATGVSRERAREELFFVAPDGRRWSGAEAVARILLRVPGWRLAGRLILLRGVRPLAELGYRWVAEHRPLVSRLTGLRAPDDAGS